MFGQYNRTAEIRNRTSGRLIGTIQFRDMQPKDKSGGFMGSIANIGYRRTIATRDSLEYNPLIHNVVIDGKKYMLMDVSEQEERGFGKSMIAPVFRKRVYILRLE